MRIQNLLLLVALALLPLTGFAASEFSYVYIQGDKQTPFYVKLEDDMQPRYGKNYCILSKLAPGPAHLEILFQQNAFPPQRFVIRVPESGNREFMIVQRNGVFNLYDLQQQFYLPAGNALEDDRLQEVVEEARPSNAVATQGSASSSESRSPEKPIVVQEAPQQTEPGAFDNGVKKAGEVLAKGREKSAALAKKAVKPLRPIAPATSENEARQSADGKPTFIGGMELSTPNTDPDAIPITRTNSGTVRQTARAPIVNSDCPNALSSADFGKVFNGVSAYSTDEDRLDYLGKQLDKCYETWQARTLAGKFEGDAARYELLRKIYPRITDQAAFALLDDLLSSPVWKDAFNKLVNR